MFISRYQSFKHLYVLSLFAHAPRAGCAWVSELGGWRGAGVGAFSRGHGDGLGAWLEGGGGGAN